MDIVTRPIPPDHAGYGYMYALGSMSTSASHSRSGHSPVGLGFDSLHKLRASIGNYTNRQ